MRRKVTELKSDRHFQLWEYLVSHGSLLLRSPISGETKDRPGQTTNMDLVFAAVEYISLPHYVHGFEILEPTREEDKSIRQLVGKGLHENVKVHVLLSEGKRYYVAGICSGLWENDWDLFESPLDFHHMTRSVDVPRPITSLQLDVFAPAPWVFENSAGPFEGVLVDHTATLLLAKLFRPIRYRQSQHRIILARVQDGNSKFEIQFGKVVECKLTPIRDMEIFSVDPDEAIEVAEKWAKYGGEGLSGCVTILNRNRRYIADRM